MKRLSLILTMAVALAFAYARAQHAPAAIAHEQGAPDAAAFDAAVEGLAADEQGPAADAAAAAVTAVVEEHEAEHAAAHDADAELTEAAEHGKKGIDPKAIIFEHLGDAYGWEVPFNHHVRIPLPIIVKAKDGGWHCFSSARVQHGHEYVDGGATFLLAPEGAEHQGKVVQKIVEADGAVEYVRPLDISITKNVAALFISMALIIGLLLWLASWYRRHPHKAPRKGLGAIEGLTQFVYDGVIKSTLKADAPRFAPYLMTVFYFILGMNLLGLIVIFPGGANLTGNIAVTLVLSICTFLVTNIFGTKEYWKEIFWPDVPLWLKFPLPIMPVIEIFGMFTKPAALTVRLFANMMGGHMIVLVLTLLIFIFWAMSPVAGGLTTVVSVGFSVFMLVIDTLVSFIQAYVFTMLSTIFISLAQAKGHEHHQKESVAEAIEDALV